MAPQALGQDLTMDTEFNSITEEIVSPFPYLPVNLSSDELKATAYDVFLAACAPVLKKKRLSSSSSPKSTPSRCRRSLFSSLAFGCFKRSQFPSSFETYSKLERPSLRLSEFEAMRIQMDVTEQNDVRARRALAKNFKVVGISGALHVPLELLLNVNSSDFSSLLECERWQKRQLKVLEAGILSQPSCCWTSDTKDVLSYIRQAVEGNAKIQLETGKTFQTLRNFQATCVAISGKAFGYPLNVHIYKVLLMSLFDSLEENTFAENCQITMSLVKRTWRILGIEQALHSICFLWVVFRQFVLTGATEASLLEAIVTVLREIVIPLVSRERLEYKELLVSVLTSILSWVEQVLLDYRNKFSSRSNEVMESLVHLAVLASQILQTLRGGVELKSLITGNQKLEKYVVSSLQSIFLKICQQFNHHETSEVGKKPNLALVALATSTEGIAFEEQQKFSPLFKLWLPDAVNVAARTLHTCYWMELKQYLSSNPIPTTDVVKILQSAATLERTLMQMVVQEVPSSNLGEFPDHHIVPFASDAGIAAIINNWLKQRIEQLQEWSERSIKQETWITNARKEQYAPSAVELLRFVEETLDAFLKLPVFQDIELLQDITLGLDTILNQYVHLVMVGCGEKEDYTQNEVLSRCKNLSKSIITKLNHSWKEKFESYVIPSARVCPELNHESLPYMSGPVNLRCLCIRINTLFQIFTEIEFLEKKIRFAWQELPPDPYKTVPSTLIAACVKFEGTRSSCQENIKKLCGVIAYKVVFGEMKGVFWDGLHWEGIHARMVPTLEQLNLQLEIIAETVTDRLRNQIVNHIMITCYDCFLQALYKKSTWINENDVLKFKDDLNAFKDLFISNGEGLPENLVEEAAEPLHQFLSSLPFKTKDPESLSQNIEVDIAAVMRSITSKKGTPHQFSASSNTISNVLGHTYHVMASNLVMRTYSFGKA